MAKNMDERCIDEEGDLCKHSDSCKGKEYGWDGCLMAKMKTANSGQMQRGVMWRGSDGMTEPVKVECPDGLYPNNDADGIQIFENTHFRTEESAWQNIEDNILAGISLSGSAVEHAQSQLRQAERQAADATVEFKIFRKAKTLRKMQDT